MRDSDVVLIVAMLTVICFTLAIGFTEIFARLRPRVIYVYRREDETKDDIPIWNKRAADKETRAQRSTEHVDEKLGA